MVGSATGSLLLFWSAFDSMPFGSGTKSADWIEQRFRYWRAFTLASVLGQSEGEFRYWLVCSAANRALTESLGERIGDERVQLVYTDEWPRRLRDLPRAKRYLLARLDSDDMYHPGVAANLLARPARTDYLQFNRGYACDVTTGEVRDWVSPSSPFYCRVYGAELRRIERFEVTNHTTVRARAQVLGPGHFLVTLHGGNTSSRIRQGHGRLTGERAQRVLRAFGLGAARRLSDPGKPPAALQPDELVPHLCGRVAARRVLALGDGRWARAARAHAAARAEVACERTPVRAPDGEVVRAYDLVIQDRPGRAARGTAGSEAVRSVLPTGLVFLPHGIGALREWCFDRYPEVEALGGQARRRAALLGRLIPAGR